MSDFSLSEINERISKTSVFVDDLKKGMNRMIIGQDELINKILISMLANGHILLEGVPGLAKTMTVKTLRNSLLQIFNESNSHQICSRLIYWEH